MTPDELLTKKDLQDFKNELFELLQPLNGSQSFFQQKWLKNEEVKKLMKVSNATIQNLRVNGTLPYNKIGGIYYYRQEDIEQMLNGVEKKPEEEKITPAKTQTFSCRYYLKASKNLQNKEGHIYIRLIVNGVREDWSSGE